MSVRIAGLYSRMELLPTHGCVERDGTHGGDRPADGPGDPNTRCAKRGAGKHLRQRHAEHQIGERRNHELLHKARAAEHTVGDELGRHDEVERRDDAQERNACIHCLPRGALKEDVYKWLPGEHIKCHQRHAQRPDELDSRPETRFDAVKFRRT